MAQGMLWDIKGTPLVRQLFRMLWRRKTLSVNFGQRFYVRMPVQRKHATEAAHGPFKEKFWQIMQGLA